MERDWDVRAGELSRASYDAGSATGWFDRLYAEGRAGSVSMPWDRDEPQALLREWAERSGLRGEGRRAVVVGCGLGADAAYLASLGFATTGFDVAPTAIEVARERHAASGAEFAVADLLDLPPAWSRAFDLVVEIYTLQALPDPPRAAATRAVAGLVAPGGTLLAVAFRAGPDDDPDQGPPFPMTRARMDALAVDDVAVVEVEQPEERWRITYERRS